MRASQSRSLALGIAVMVVAIVAGFAMAQAGTAGPRVGADDPGREGAVAFEPGVSFEDAIVALHVAQSSGIAPLSMEPADPLPAGVVALIPSGPDDRVVLDLARPFGYDTALGVPISATYTGPEPTADTPRSEVGPWYRGWDLVIPGLPECMVIHARGERPTACTDVDKVTGFTSATLPS